VFSILQKNKDHYSKKYNNAPMPNMQRLTWDGIALHAGNLPGYPASHGCVRLPLEFSKLLFGVTSIGATVVITRSREAPSVVAGDLLVANRSPSVAGRAQARRNLEMGCGRRSGWRPHDRAEPGAKGCDRVAQRRRGRARADSCSMARRSRERRPSSCWKVAKPSPAGSFPDGAR
jgi:hypothetical protein